MINNISVSVTGALAGTGPVKTVITPIPPTSPINSATAAADTVELSTLSRQLSESSARAETRDKDFSRSQLSDLARTLRGQFSGEIYHANKATHDAEVPDTHDPGLLARAKQATDFVTRTAIWDTGAKNPFVELTREQLSLIAYDDAGSYTVNERRAAWYGIQDMTQEWSKKVAAQAMDEYNRTGNAHTPAILFEVLSHYKSLPPIEKAQYPGDYETRLLGRISEGGGVQNTEDDRLLTLFEVLANIQLPEKESGPTVPGLRMNSLSPDVSPTPAAVLRS